MSSGTRSVRSGSASSKMEEVQVPVTITLDEIESIVQKAVSTAVVELKELFNNKLQELSERVAAAEAHITMLEGRLSDFSHPTTGSSQSQVTDGLSMELEAMRTETRESLLLSNDNEQYSRLNNLRFCGLKPDANEECRVAAARFIRDVLHVQSVTESDIDVAHMTAGFVQASGNQQRRPTMLVRFCRRDKRDLVIRSRRILKGTHFAVTEDLTTLNTKTMNRLKNSEQVRSTWSWNGKLFAILSNGKKVTVRPFQSVNELQST